MLHVVINSEERCLCFGERGVNGRGIKRCLWLKVLRGANGKLYTHTLMVCSMHICKE